MYNRYQSSVGNNQKHLQITSKYRYQIMNDFVIKTSCKVAVEEACKRYKIKIEIVKILNEHVHMIVDCPRTMCDSEMARLIKGFSSYLIFRMFPNLRNRYSRGHFWSAGYFCCSVGADFDRVFEYVKNQ